MKKANDDRSTQTVVLIVDDVLDNLAVLHDALDESGFVVLIAQDGATALATAAQAQPDVILLDAIMPGLDGFEVCRRLKQELVTRHIPVIFMTGLTESENIVAGFEAGGTDYVTKPIRTAEVLARISAHLKTSRLVHQTRGVLDAFGQAAIAVTPGTGKIVWQTPLARQWMERYFGEENMPEYSATMPPELVRWLKELFEGGIVGLNKPTLTIPQGSGRLIFTLVEIDNDDQWVILLHEESDAAKIDALMTTFKLTRRESEVLYWAIQGKTNRDIGDILGTSPRTINKHLEHVFTKLGVETRTAASALARSKLKI
jgi:DNA-binding response OmpR family regulator/DNA-binding CsgD family transcriptional regulator